MTGKNILMLSENIPEGSPDNIHKKIGCGL